jgi:hypothetical protein
LIPDRARDAISPTHTEPPRDLPLRERRFDAVLAVVFLTLALSAAPTDVVVMLGVPIVADSPNPVARAVWWYAHDCDPLILTPPFWMRIAVGMSVFLYIPFYVVLSYCLVRGRSWIRLPAAMCSTLIVGVTSIVLGVELFGEPVWRTNDPVKLLLVNAPFVLMPLVVLARMRRPSPFARRF